MSLSLHTLAPGKGARTKSFRVGRGEGSGRGKTSGKGTKGQRSRTGGRKGLKLKGIKQMLLGFPKLRGFQSVHEKADAVKLPDFIAAFPKAQKIDMAALKKAKLIGKNATRAKLVGTATVEAAYVILNVKASESAKAAIEKAGGSFAKQRPAAKRMADAAKVKKAKAAAATK